MWTRKTDAELEDVLQRRKQNEKRKALLRPFITIIGVAVLAVASETIKRGRSGQETPIEIMIVAFVLIVPALVAFQTYKSIKKKNKEQEFVMNECTICINCHETQLFEGVSFCRDCGSKIEPVSYWKRIEK